MLTCHKHKDCVVLYDGDECPICKKTKFVQIPRIEFVGDDQPTRPETGFGPPNVGDYLNQARGYYNITNPVEFPQDEEDEDEDYD